MKLGHRKYRSFCYAKTGKICFEKFGLYWVYVLYLTYQFVVLFWSNSPAELIKFNWWICTPASRLHRVCISLEWKISRLGCKMCESLKGDGVSWACVGFSSECSSKATPGNKGGLNGRTGRQTLGLRISVKYTCVDFYCHPRPECEFHNFAKYRKKHGIAFANYWKTKRDRLHVAIVFILRLAFYSVNTLLHSVDLFCFLDLLQWKYKSYSKL